MIKWVATFCLIWLIYQVRHVFPPIIVGGIFAYLLLPLVQQLAQKTKLTIGWATMIVYLSVLALLVGTVWLIGPGVMKELKDLADPENQREIIHGAVQQVSQIINWRGDIDLATEQIMRSLSDAIGKPEELMHIGGLLSHGFLSILVCVVSSIYLCLDAPAVGRFFLFYVPEPKRASVVKLTAQMNRLLSKYVQGQILLIVIMSTVAWVFLHFGIHMKYALPVAILSGFLEIIPVLGPILATTTATLVGISQFGAGTGIGIIVFYTLARWIEDYVIVPKVIGHAVELHPLAVIFAVLCGETLAGALGMLIAIPVAACIKLAIDFFYFGDIPTEGREESTPPEAKAAG